MSKLNKLMSYFFSEGKLGGDEPLEKADQALKKIARPLTSSDFSTGEKSYSVKRRKFLGVGLLGFAGVTFPSIPAIAHSAGDRLRKTKVGKIFNRIEETYWDRTERFEEKVEMLQSAWDRKDFKIVRALTDSLRNTCLQAQVEGEEAGVPLLGATQYEKVESLPDAWRTWAKGWKYYKVVDVVAIGNGQESDAETPMLGYPLTSIPNDQFICNEPIEVSLVFPSDQISSPSREN